MNYKDWSPFLDEEVGGTTDDAPAPRTADRGRARAPRWRDEERDASRSRRAFYGRRARSRGLRAIGALATAPVPILGVLGFVVFITLGVGAMLDFVEMTSAQAELEILASVRMD